MVLEECKWMLAVGAALFFLNSCLLGANNLSLAWGPAIGAKVVGFEVAAPVGAVCAVVGAILFGDRNAPIYGGYLKSYTVLQDLPELTIYAMLWWPLVLLIWQVMALYWQVPVVPYLGFASAMAGTALIYPGWKEVNWGVHITQNPIVVSGMGAVYVPWVAVPWLTIVIVIFIFLVMRTYLMRGEDPFHQTLWCLLGIGCVTTIVNVAYILYTLSSDTGWHFNNLSPQGVVITLCACGIFGLLSYITNMPAEVRRARLTAPRFHPVKRVNLLGLDEETLHILKAEDPSTGVKSWLHKLYKRFYVRDIDATITHDENVAYMHSNAENFYRPAEFCFAKMQIITCCLLSMGHAAGTLQVAANGFATMLHIYKTGYVSVDSPITLSLRGIAAAGMALGILLAGWRLVPVSGIQLAKMSPFRSYVVTTASTLTATVVNLFRPGGGTTTYINISAVVAIGVAEGISHVNWRKVRVITAWWTGSLAPICLFTAALVAQGVYPPSAVAVTELSQTESAIDGAIQALAFMRHQSGPDQGSISQETVTLTGAVQQAIEVFSQALRTCQFSVNSTHG